MRDDRLDEAHPPRKEDRPCCVSRRDADGRLPIGYCSPECLGRPDVWRQHVREVERQRKAAAHARTERLRGGR